MKILTLLVRIMVAATFIFSGFVKLVDPIGSQIKMKEYLAPDVLNMSGLIPYALLLAILLILAELILGVMLLVGYKPKLTLLGITLLMLVFLFLTWYSAYYNKVTDCGCFGDAVKLGQWETFYKNVILMVLVAFLWWNVTKIKPFIHQNVAMLLSFIAFIGSMYISYYVLQHLPIIDFTAYKVGTYIPKAMEFTDAETIPEIHDFVFENETDDLTDTILQSDKVLLIISESLSQANSDNFTAIRTLTDKALDKGYKVFMLSGSSMEEFALLKQKYGFNFEMLWGDTTTLKTMVRANPGIMMLEKGTITGKWNGNDADKASQKL